MPDPVQPQQDSGAEADYTQALEPLTDAQTQAVIDVLIEAHYGGHQTDHADADRAYFHSRLSEALESPNRWPDPQEPV